MSTTNTNTAAVATITVQKTIPHATKIAKALAALPELGSSEQTVLDALLALGAEGVAKVTAHAETLLRQAAVTSAALGKAPELNIGDYVRVVGGTDPRFLGREGTVSEVKKVRCKVDLGNGKAPLYLFRAEVQVISKAPVAEPVPAVAEVPAAEVAPAAELESAEPTIEDVDAGFLNLAEGTETAA